MLKRKAFSALLLGVLLLPTFAFGQTAIYEVPADVLARMKEEGTKNSQVMKTLNYLTDVIGPRLTGSPGMKRANEWTRDTLAGWGLQNAKLESWGPFGRGWTLKRYSAMVDGPAAFPFLSYPKAWSPGTDTLTKSKAPFTAEVVHLNARTEADLEAFKGKLRGKIVLVGATRAVPAWLEAPGRRFTDSELLALADAPDPNAPPRPNANPSQPQGPSPFAQAAQFNQRRLRFLQEEGAAILIDTAGKGDGGTIFVSGATAYPATTPAAPGTPNLGVRDKNANVPVQVGAAVEHFNRVARMLEAGEKVTMTMDLAVEFQDADMNSYNTVAEIPGTDKADEVVMLGAHLDSWHAGTGATDNASGSAVMMEAVRIIQTLGLKPRRTIRIGLWSGEEQGLFGSRAYVRQHFGYREGGQGGGGGGQNAGPLTKLPAYDKFSAYYNIDNGTGKIRGIYMQGNEGVRPIFRRWLEAFKDPKWYDGTDKVNMSAYTLSLANTGGTDHLAFDAVGLPGFQFIQDPMEYSTRTHHSNMDSLDRIQPDDVKQMSIIVAALVYQTAMMEEKLPRKAVR